MKQRFIFLLISLLLTTFRVTYAQETDYRITLGGNLRLAGNASQGMYPVLGYDKTLDQKVLVGGFNAGLSAFFYIAPRLNLKGSLNVSRQVFWSEPMYFNKGPNPGDALGYINPKAIEYYSSLLGIVHYVPEKKFSAGAGLGIQFLLASHVKAPSHKGTSTAITGTLQKREFKPIMPTILAELSWKEERFLYNVRYELGLLNRYRGDLAEHGGNTYHVIYFEVGMKI